MDVLSPCDVSVSGPFDLKQSCANQKRCCNDTETTNKMEKLGNALTRILNIHDIQLQLSGCVSLSVAAKLSEEFNSDQSEILDARTRENFNNCLKSPCAEKELSKLVFADEKQEVPGISLDAKTHVDSVNLENLDSLHPTSLPVPIKPISAMKGSREKLGISLTKLNVTWAPDVYDPLPTSVSHMMKNHSQHRSRSKKYSKQKYKAKSSHGSSNSCKRYEKHVGKSSHRSKSSSTSERMVFGVRNHSPLELSGLTVTDSKCGSSVLGTSLANVQIPVAEAAA